MGPLAGGPQWTPPVAPGWCSPCPLHHFCLSPCRLAEGYPPTLNEYHRESVVALGANLAKAVLGVGAWVWVGSLSQLCIMHG